GKSAPVRAMELLGIGRPDRAPMPLLGRDDDLIQLELVSRRAIAERRPFLATLIAPPGTGKTRLLEEFLERLPRTGPSAQVAVAQCLPYGQRLTYWPLRAVLHQLVGIPEDAPPDTVRAATVRWLTDAQVADPVRVCSYLAATVGVGEADVADPGVLFGAWRTFVEAAAERAPLVLVFEDLHWSSDGLLDLVEHVMQPRADVPVLMLVLTRPELLDRRPSWGAGRRNQVSLALQPLDDGSVAQLVRHLLESAPAELVDAIVARAEGNPFYAGELVRSVLDRVGPDGVGAGPTEMLRELPDTVQSTVLARLDLLPRDERRTLQLGAVLGRSFSTTGIAALEPALSGPVGDIMETLLDRDMIRVQGGDRYAFRHILIREVAYSTLPRAERARLHGSAGDWIEAFAHGQEEAYAELIAYHFLEAAILGQAMGSAQATTVRSKAYRWLVRAAESAAAAAAGIEADRHLRNALELAAPADLPELHERLGDVRLSGDKTVREYETAYRLSVEAGRPADDRFRVLAKLLEYEMRFEGSIGGRRSIDEMDASIAEARALGEHSTDKRAHVIFLTALSFRPFWQQLASVRHEGQLLHEAEVAGLAALELARELDDAQITSAALDGLG
ncbi:MAG TPA: AAA family ATPase, partial [Candidatus Limnocylindrales bacterium]|nr:AAA family ATPase [Candidatus Limnocylindrales bacterium]